MNVYEQHKVLKAIAVDLENSRIGCGTEALVDTATLVILLEAVQQLPDAPPPELQQAYQHYDLFTQVQDAVEVPDSL